MKSYRIFLVSPTEAKQGESFSDLSLSMVQHKKIKLLLKKKWVNFSGRNSSLALQTLCACVLCTVFSE